jgi:M6 family metalloprotease-like protein
VKNQVQYIFGVIVFGLGLALLVRETFVAPETEVGTSNILTAQARLKIQRTRATESQRVHNVRSATTRQNSQQKKSLSDQESRSVDESSLFPVYGYHWGREVIPELRDFSKWADEYAKTPQRSQELVAEGVGRAKARREMMLALINVDPQVALASAIPRDVREQLPAVVLTHSERHISGVGNLEVAIVTPEAGVKALGPLVQRSARLLEGTYQAHVYGQMKRFGTVDEIYLHGVAVGDQLALADTPMRPLEVGESLISGKKVEANHPVSPSLANRVRGGGIGPFFAEGKEGYKCLCCAKAKWDNYDAYLGTKASGGDNTAAVIGRAYNNTGEKKLLLIPVEFPDKTGSPWSSTTVRDNRINAIQDYFNTVSYGTFTVPTVTVAPLQLLDNNATYYNAQGYTVLKNDAASKSQAAGDNPDDYEFVSIVINHNLYSGWAGRGQVGDKYNWIDGYNSGSELDQTADVYVHELGHNLGLFHANSWDPASSTPDDPSGTHDEYGFDFDMMGNGSYSYDKMHFNASFKNAMDWLSDSSITTVTSDTTIDLHVMDQTQVAGRTYAIKIPAGISLGSSSNLDYWIEFRSRFPSKPTLDDGVLIYMSDDDHTDEALKLLDMNPSTSTVSDAGLDKGESFTISSSRWKITVDSQTGSGADSLVKVTVSDARPPTISSNPKNVSTSLESAVTFTVSAIGPGLLYQWYKDGASIVGETSSTLTISNFQESDKGSYHVVVSNSFGTTTSSTATLSVTSSGGGGGCGAVPPLTIFMLGWVTMGFNRLCLLLNFGFRSGQGCDSRKVEREQSRGKTVVHPSPTK